MYTVYMIRHENSYWSSGTVYYVSIFFWVAINKNIFFQVIWSPQRILWQDLPGLYQRFPGMFMKIPEELR
jgi:hypothetical protein